MLINPNKKNSESFNPSISNEEIKANAHSFGKAITYISFILIIPLILYILKRNEIVRLQMKINESSSGIDVQLKKRRDTLVKIIDAIKGSMKFEKETLKQITELRANKNNNQQKMMELTDNLTSSINLAVEAYPKIKSTNEIKNLIDVTKNIELEIAATRRLYNSYVTKFNSCLFVWPSSVVATNMGLNKFPLFLAKKEDKKDVSINFEE